VEIVRHCATRFDGLRRRGGEPIGCDIPYGARILAIADAFDAMTTDRVYRPAMSRERAVAELFESAGTQFDPELVERFCWISSQTEAQLQRRVSRRWLQPVAWDPASVSPPDPPLVDADSPSTSGLALFQQRLLDGMNDAVIFVDPRWRIAFWNQGAERLTGVTADSVLEREWHHALLDLRDPDGNLYRDLRCPIRQVIGLGQQVICRATIARTSGDRVTVEVHAIPVNDEQDGSGAILILRDASSETHLEARVQDLSEQATTDQLTGASNRAQFDHTHASLVERSLLQRATFSIILCDIDRFKQVNDRFGHQAGDEVLVQFARLLQRCSRAGDLVARYGGEEFVVLCPECDNATAARRAEQLRSEWARMPQPALDQEVVTASFGVTELQAGDTAETMLRRVDRALYQAKDGGRNQVVQLGAGFTPEESEVRRGWRSWWQRRPLRSLIQRTLVTSVPLNVAAEKIRGFIADHEAEIVRIEENHIVLTVNVRHFEPQRRRSDRPTLLLIDLQVQEVSAESRELPNQTGTHTVAQVTIRPRRERDRRSRVSEQAALILSSLKAYLIAQEIVEQ
jgi:diguanylate cyclase (GGDEF)-like protein/PAS domain S-box-containing protein